MDEPISSRNGNLLLKAKGSLRISQSMDGQRIELPSPQQTQKHPQNPR